jgi:hypothetical protein
MRQETFSLCVAASLLLSALAGCTQHPQQTVDPKSYAPVEQGSAMQRSTRAIIHFQRPTSDNPALSTAIAAACHCQPVFFRSYPGDALIYGITLPPGSGFAEFAETLMRDAEKLGIRAVEQDSIMQHQ